MLVGYTSSIDRYREQTSASIPFVHKPKRCPVRGCGKAARAKQLSQYGKCIACVRAQAARNAAMKSAELTSQVGADNEISLAVAT